MEVLVVLPVVAAAPLGGSLLATTQGEFKSTKLSSNTLIMLVALVRTDGSTTRHCLQWKCLVFTNSDSKKNLT